eukprot:5080220-Heterocapsa_arctica.AAC.1
MAEGRNTAIIKGRCESWKNGPRKPWRTARKEPTGMRRRSAGPNRRRERQARSLAMFANQDCRGLCGSLEGDMD